MNRRAAVLVIAVFVLGFTLGGLSTHLVGDRVWGGYSEAKKYPEKGRYDPARIVEQLTRELALTSEQRKQLESILETTKAKHQAVYEQVRPQFEQVRQEGRARIRSILTPEQLPKFEEWLRRLDEERKKKQTG